MKNVILQDETGMGVSVGFVEGYLRVEACTTFLLVGDDELNELILLLREEKQRRREKALSPVLDNDPTLYAGDLFSYVGVA